MAVCEVLLLGNPRLLESCQPLRHEELEDIHLVVQDLHDTLMDFRKRYGAGRAISAPQIGVMKRFVYMHIDQPVVFLNPVLDQLSAQTFTLRDDCMCFPDLLVHVKRHRACRITYRDLTWVERNWVVKDNLSELLQHECDHLEGILAVARATGPDAFALRSQRKWLSQI